MIKYQTEIQNLDNLASGLNGLKERLKQEVPKSGVHPPRWNRDIQGLKDFRRGLSEWLDEPRLKEVKDIIRKFQGICDDKREFRFGESKRYYISILDVLRQGKEILSDITNDDINKKAVQVILNQVILKNKEELEEEINKIKGYWAKFNEKIINFDTKKDAFIEEVKNDSIKDLIKSLKTGKTGFNSDEVNNTYQKIEQAKNSRELLKEIDSNAFLSEYEKNKDIDGIWNISDTVRKKLNATDVDIAGIPEDTNRKIFRELLDYKEIRANALNETNLTKINDKLGSLFENLKKWSKKVNRFIKGDIEQFDFWLIAIKNSETSQERIQGLTTKTTGLKQKLGSLRFDDVTEIKTEELYATFEKYYALKKEIKGFFKDLLGEDAREVLDNLSNLEKIRNDMGDKFWQAIKELCDTFPQLKIKMEWSEGQ